MAIRFYCPLGHRLQAPETQQGKLVHCPACRQRVIVPLLDLDRQRASEEAERTGPKHFVGQPPHQTRGGWALPAFSQPAPLQPTSPLESPQGDECLWIAPGSSGSEGWLSDESQAASLAPNAQGGGNGQAGPSAPESPSGSDSAIRLVEWVAWAPEGELPWQGRPQRDPSPAGEDRSQDFKPSPGPSSMDPSAWSSEPPMPSGVVGGPPPQHSPAPIEQPGCLEDFFLAEHPPNTPPEDLLWQTVLQEFQSAEWPEEEISQPSPALAQTPPPNESAITASAATRPPSEAAGQVLDEVPKTLERKRENHQSQTRRVHGVPPDSSKPSPDEAVAGKISASGQAASFAGQGPRAGSLASPSPNPPGWFAGSKSVHWPPPKPVDLDPVRRHEVRWLAFWLGLIVLFSIGPAFRYLLLGTAPGWARVVVLFGLWELAYLAWMVLSVHRIAVWIIMGVFAAGATLSAVTTAFTLVASGHTVLPGGLTEIRRWAPSWFGCVLAVQTLGAYLAGRLAFLWGQMDRRLARHRLAS